jgi:hypothetical protein
MIKHWIREGGKAYCIGPEEEMFPDIDVECPPCPGKYYEYSYVNSQWVKDDDKLYDYNKLACVEEIRRTDKYMVIDTPLTQEQIDVAKKYRSFLRNYLVNRPVDVSLPTCPVFLK